MIRLGSSKNFTYNLYEEGQTLGSTEIPQLQQATGVTCCNQGNRAEREHFGDHTIYLGSEKDPSVNPMESFHRDKI